MLIPEAILCHYSQGRVRIRLALKKNDPNYFDHLKNIFLQLAGIKEVKSNSVSKSLLLITSLAADTIFDFAAKNNLFILKNDISKKSFFESKSHSTHNQISKHMLTEIAESIQKYDANIKNVTKGNIDLRTLTFGALMGFGLYQLMRGQFLASGSSLVVTAIALLPLHKIYRSDTFTS